MVAESRVDVGVRVLGVDETVRTLRAFDKGLYRRMLMATRKAVEPIRAEAAGRAPRGTRPHRDGDGPMAASYRVKRGKARQLGRRGSFGYIVHNPTRAATILEFAGSVSAGNTPQGRSLIRNLTARYGNTGRFAWQAHDRRKASTEAALLGAVRAAEMEMQTRLNRTVV